MTNAPVCLSVIQSKSSDVNPIWPSLFEQAMVCPPGACLVKKVEVNSLIHILNFALFFEGKVCQH